jgi:hypothetical protein
MPPDRNTTFDAVETVEKGMERPPSPGFAPLVTGAQPAYFMICLA